MARIPTYFRRPLASEQTGTPGMDNSGAMIAQSVKGAADAFFQATAFVAQQQKTILDQSEIAKGVGEFAVSLAETSDRVRTENAMKPDLAFSQSQKAYAEMKDQHLSSISDGPLRQQMGAQFDRLLMEQKVQDTTWKLGQQRVVAQKNYADTLNANAKALGVEGTSYETYLNQVKEWSAQREDFGRVFGVDKQEQMVEQGLEAYTRAYVTGQVDQGKSAGVLQQIEGGKFDPFITKEAKADLKDKVQKAYEGDLKRSKFEAYNQAAAETYEFAERASANELTIFEVEEKVSQLAWEEAQARQSGAPKEVIAAKEKQRETLSLLRDARVEQIATQVTEDDLDASTRLWSEFNALVSIPKAEDGEKKISSLGKLDEVLTFQQKATKAFYDGQLTQKTYDKWMSFSKVAAYNTAIEQIKPRNAFGAIGDAIPGLPNSGANVNKKYRDAIRDISSSVGQANPLMSAPGDVTQTDPEWALDAFNFYVDEINDRSQGKPEGFQADENTMNDILKRAKGKASLKQAGLPVYLNAGDSIETFAGHYKFAGLGPRGEILVEVPQGEFK